MRSLYPLSQKITAYLHKFQPIASEPGFRQQMQNELREESRADLAYLVLVVSSCIIATLGLLSNSAAVIIGAMIIAPLMMPIRGLSFAVLDGDWPLVRRAAIAIIYGTLLALAISWGIGLMVGLPNFGSEILARSKPNLLDLGIAVAAGAISGYAKVEPKISGTLAGTAIAVALMPPVCVIGLGLSHADTALSLGAGLLYLTNLLGITLAGMLTFVVTGFMPLRQAGRPLVLTIIFTAMLLIPLSVSFSSLIRQARLEDSLKRALLDRTLTFQRVQLLYLDANWLTQPPQVRLAVRAKDPITPRQVQLLEKFISQEMQQPITLIFDVSQVQEVRGQ